MPLDPSETALIHCVEAEFLMHGALPTRTRISELTSLTEKRVSELLRRETVRDALTVRAIPWQGFLTATGDSDVSVEDGALLTPEQLHCINTLLDFNDTRSDIKKLRELKIPSKTYQAWCKDPVFNNYMHARVNDLFGGQLHEIHRALFDTARGGDISAIKLIYEKTGHYNPRREESLDVANVITRVLESIQRHVSSLPGGREAMLAISNDLLAYTNPIASRMAVIDARPMPQPMIEPQHRVIEHVSDNHVSDNHVSDNRDIPDGVAL